MRTFMMTVLAFLAALPSFAYRPDAADSRELVVYRRDLAEVREVRTVTLPSGTGYVDLHQIAPTLQAGSAKIELISGRAKTSSIETLNRLLDIETYWDDLVGETVTLKLADTTYTGVLRRVTSLHLFFQEGEGPGLTILSRGDAEDALEIKSLPEGVVTETTLRWHVRDAKGGKAKIRLTYLAGQITWNGHHRLTLDGSKASLQAATLIDNACGIALPYNRLVLVGGQIHLAGDQRKVDRMNPAPGAKESDKASRFGVVRRWTVDQPGILSSNSKTLITLSDTNGLDAKRVYVYDAAIYDDRVRAQVEVTPTEAIPAGKVLVYRVRSGEDWFTSSDAVDDTPPGSPLKLTLAQAFDLTAERTRVREIGASGEDTRQTIRVQLGNSGSTDVTVRVLDRLFGDWSISNATVDDNAVEPIDLDARTVGFDVAVPVGKTVSLTYEIRYAR